MSVPSTAETELSLRRLVGICSVFCVVLSSCSPFVYSIPPTDGIFSCRGRRGSTQKRLGTPSTFGPPSRFCTFRASQLDSIFGLGVYGDAKMLAESAGNETDTSAIEVSSLGVVLMKRRKGQKWGDG